MPYEVIPVDSPPTDPPITVSPTLVRVVTGSVLALAIGARLAVRHFGKEHWDGDLVTSSGVRAPREWTSVTDECDGFLAQLKNVIPTDKQDS